MDQLTVSDRDTAYVWVGRDTGGRPGPAVRLLRQAGAALLGRAEAEVVLAHGPAGNPVVRIAGPESVELPVSVSRAGRVVVVAARAAGPVGVDVEQVRALPALALARRWFPPAELAWLADRPEAGRAAEFLRLWTAKEAVGKALGVGLRGGGLLREMPPPGLPLRQVPGGEPVRVGHPELGGGLVLAVAVRAEAGVEVAVEVVQRAGPAVDVAQGPGPDVDVAQGPGPDVEADVAQWPGPDVEVVQGAGPDVEVVQGAGHGVAADRSAPVERTSLPVVVRGNASSRRSTRGRL
ncbi:4'-phosphopantetheinyl transferase superfamily protein [Micromonospora sp. NPDC049114]|uniref:4'-phosphopantetheinyl transferase family protein n=1 Tax=Micromonospora sp. NPDC049114 TaxID=3155498 RepID=UPI00340C356A